MREAEGRNLPNKNRIRQGQAYLSRHGVFRVGAAISTLIKEPSMWYIFGLVLAVIAAGAFVLSRRPNRRTTIVIERD
jgi:hypothetical protein